ncbi:MAG TPA: lysis protein [Leclercia adecarboxylata]|nr:lysis protein [Leclercia adecarboxylata]
MKFDWKPVLLLVVMAVLGALAFWYHGKAADEQHRADTAEHNLNLANDTINDMQTRQRDVDALDAKYTKELADAKAENDALQRKLDNGGRVLVKGRCPVPASTEAASASSMDHEATIELSDAAGRNVLGIRSGIRQDQSALRVLQEYINTQCLK